MPFTRKVVLAIVGVAASGGAGLIYSLENTIQASDIHMAATKYPWNHLFPFRSFDHASIRRGYEVYKNVCAACHGLKYLPYRRMVGVCLTDAEARKEASEIMYKDGPNEDGEMFMRPGEHTDYIKGPYENKIQAKIANNGAAPPDLSLITLARDGSEDYVFSLMTGYTDPPAGVNIEEGLHYNVYFPGGAIAMGAPLYNEIIEYSDGTPASLSQCAKDVTTFLTWVASPEQDVRLRLWGKAVALLLPMALALHYITRVKFNPYKCRRWEYIDLPPAKKRTVK